MVISHKHKYLFIQLPQTACTAVQNELIENYDGEKIHFKHAFYSDFLKNASAEEKKYFVFSSLRNPLDIVVSKYFKYKTDHVGAYSNQRKKKFGKFHKYLLWYTDKARYNFITNDDASFGDFFRKFYTLPYASWAVLDHQNFDYIIRYENLQEDFAQMLKLINVEPVRPIPSKNVTGTKSRDFWSYYDTPELREKAVKLFGNYMEDFEYDFPEEFKQFSKASDFKYNMVTSTRKFYWNNLR